MPKNESRIKKVAEKVTPRKLIATGLTAAALAAAGCAPTSQENTEPERPKAATEKINQKLQSAAQKGSKYVLAVLKKDPTKVISIPSDDGRDVTLTVFTEKTENYGDAGSERESRDIEVTYGKMPGTIDEPIKDDIKTVSTTKIVTIKKSGKPTEHFIDSTDIYTPFSERAEWDASISSSMLRNNKTVTDYSSYDTVGGAFDELGAIEVANNVSEQLADSIKTSREMRNN